MINFWVVLLGVVGFGIAFHIYRKVKRGEHLVCVIGKKCDIVLSSKYNRILGFKNEILGMVYYSFVVILSLLFIFRLEVIFGVSLSSILIVMGIVGVLFSVYFTYVQFFVLKATCDYCIASALVNVFILTVELI